MDVSRPFCPHSHARTSILESDTILLEPGCRRSGTLPVTFQTPCRLQGATIPEIKNGTEANHMIGRSIGEKGVRVQGKKSGFLPRCMFASFSAAQWLLIEERLYPLIVEQQRMRQSVLHQRKPKIMQPHRSSRCYSPRNRAETEQGAPKLVVSLPQLFSDGHLDAFCHGNTLDLEIERP